MGSDMGVADENPFMVPKHEIPPNDVYGYGEHAKP